MSIGKIISLSWVLLALGLQACGGGGGGTTPDVPVTPPVDTTKPVITLNGSATVNHEQGTTYSDAGATATDAVDGSVTVTTSGTVGTAAGTYTLEYSATDKAGNKATATRTVIVADTTSPVVTLVGEAAISLVEGTTYTEAGTVATDTVDTDVTVTVSGSVGATAGTYVLTYTATDDAGNTATVTRTVTVTEATNPVTETDTFILLDGVVDDIWGGSAALSFFDEKNGYADCTDEANGTETCGSVDWEIVSDAVHGDVLQVSYNASAGHAGLVVGPSGAVDLSGYATGTLSFDIKIINAGAALSDGMYLKVESGSANSGELKVPGITASSEWQSIDFPVSSLTANGQITLSSITAPMVFFPAYQTGANLVYLIDNVRFTGLSDGGTPPTGGTGGTDPNNPATYEIISYGAGSIADVINPASYRCAVDYGNWIYNAGVVLPAIAACNASTRIPTGTPTPLHPQLTGAALDRPVPTHKWWGSIPFVGEMTVGDANDAAYITPDPIRARISNKGARISSIPSGYKVIGNFPRFDGPEPFSEVFDGIAVANSAHPELNAYLKDNSDGSVTVQWKDGTVAVMDATFVHGSPYVYFKAYDGDLILRTQGADSSGAKGTFFNQNNNLGIWTDISGVRNNFLVTGEGTTTFSNITTNQITVSNATKEMTLTYLPVASGLPADSLTSFFAATARNVVAAVNINYAVDQSTNTVTVSHNYVDDQGAAIETVAGMHPLHWKNSAQLTTDYKIRSARGVVKFAKTSQFSYDLPFVGVLPTLPSITGTYDAATLQALVTDFVDGGASSWINSQDTYWSGKAYGKVAEVAAIADSIGMQAEATVLINWLKAELSDWFTAETNGNFDIFKYFAYDSEWTTLLGLEEAYGSHQRLADHHFHYGYFVRAAAEICRVDRSWCDDDQYGPMIELLIRDYAGGRDDDMFPYLRNFDPANGFSWADGKGDALQGNNNESTSEAANSYGAIVLYGMITGNDELMERGMYLHASTAAAYWEYWNNIDGYNNKGGDYNNFPAGYSKITTSIIWGSGADFSTWFSPKTAHILGIQGLPANPLILHVGLHADYMVDYVALGLSESSNGKPSGLGADQWTDLWWNLWALTDADAAIADYNTVSSYSPEAGESKAHTYHWIHTFSSLGHLATGTGDLTADYPGALAFDKAGVRTYVVYNLSTQAKVVTFSDGRVVNAAANGFTVEK